jgi:hypothetical protein
VLHNPNPHQPVSHQPPRRSFGGGLLRILWQRFGPVHPYRGLVRGTDVPGLPGLPGAWPQPLSGVDHALRTGLDLLPTWALEQKAAANRQVIAVLGGRLERGMPVVPMHGPLGLAFP